jgi:hypothetical protein
MLKLFQEWGQRGYRRMMEGVNPTLTYYKNFYKCHNVYPVQQMIIKNNCNPFHFKSARSCLSRKGNLKMT